MSSDNFKLIRRATRRKNSNVRFLMQITEKRLTVENNKNTQLNDTRSMFQHVYIYIYIVYMYDIYGRIGTREIALVRSERSRKLQAPDESHVRFNRNFSATLSRVRKYNDPCC